jgi:gliding motility-associated-like protein
MKIKLLLISILLYSPLAAQNLVPNFSFEEHSSLLCDQVVRKEQLANMIPPWTMPSNGSPDVFSMHLPQGCITHPLSTDVNYFGNIEPRHGTAMAGLSTFDNCPACLNSETYRDGYDYKEYLQVPLRSALQPGQRYLAGMWASLGDRLLYASNNIGMAFSTHAIDADTRNTLYLTPKVNREDVLANPGEWTQIFGVFTADSAYTHLLLGNFFFVDDTKRTEMHIEGYSAKVFAYYFIDSVFVEPFPVLTIPNVITPNSDGFNDAFVIDHLSSGAWALSVYNRYGQQVYYSPAYTNDWDGDGLSPGVYYYALQHAFVDETYKGWLHIIR